MKRKFLAAVFAATMAVSGLAGVAPASAAATFTGEVEIKIEGGELILTELGSWSGPDTRNPESAIHEIRLCQAVVQTGETVSDLTGPLASFSTCRLVFLNGDFLEPENPAVPSKFALKDLWVADSNISSLSLTEFPNFIGEADNASFTHFVWVVDASDNGEERFAWSASVSIGPTITTASSVSIAASTGIATGTPAAYAAGTFDTYQEYMQSNYFFACENPVTTAGRITWSPIGNPTPVTTGSALAGCITLATSSRQPDLGTVQVIEGSPQSYPQFNAGRFEDYTHIVYMHVTRLENNEATLYGAFSSSVVFDRSAITNTPTTPPPTGTSTVIDQPELILDGSVVTVTPAVWSEFSLNWLVACTDEIKVAVTSPVPFREVGVNCVTLFELGKPGTPPSNLNSAEVAAPLPGDTAKKYDPDVDGRHIAIISISGSFGISTATQTFGGGGQATSDVVRAAPFTGPVLNTPAIGAAVAGGKLVISGSNLGGVSKIEIGGLDAQVVVLADGSIEITVPRGLAAGVYDIVIDSAAGRVTVQGGLTVRAGSAAGTAGEPRPSTKLIAENSLKVWVFEAFGAGKVQILLNGREVAWANALSADDPKLRDGRLVRTLTLAAGKNVIEVYVDGERVSRRVATGS